MSAPETGHDGDASTLPISEVTRRLIVALGPTLVASLAGAQRRDAAREWAKHDGESPSSHATERLRFGYKQFRRVSASEGGEVARAWFIGSNPWLGGSTPVTAICEGRFRDVNPALRAFLDDSFSG